MSYSVYTERGDTMGIGYRIKEAREIQGLTQIELGKLVGVTGSAITNYENETSHPKEPVMYKLIEALKVDANYLFQDCVKLPKEANDVTLAEYDYIKKYRELDNHGKKMVDFTLKEEWERSIAEAKKTNVVPISLKEDTTYYVNAAHPIEGASEEDKQFDENIMDDENF